MLAGARFDSAIGTKLEVGPRDRDVAGAPLRTPADASLSSDDPATVANEDRTQIQIAGESYSLATLLGGGIADRQEETYIDQVREDLNEIYQQVKRLAEINAALDRADRSDFSATYNRKWTRDAQTRRRRLTGSSARGW